MKIVCSVRQSVATLSGALALCLVAGSAHAQVVWKSEVAGDPEALSAIIQSRENRFAPAQVLDREQVRQSLDGYRQVQRPVRVVVQLNGEPSDATRAMLARRGVTLLSPVGAGAFFARVDPGQLEADALAEGAFISNIEAIRPEWKSSPMILQNQYPDFASAVKADGQEHWAAIVQWHSDVSLEEARRLAQAGGVEIRSSVAQTNALVVEGPADRVRALIDLDEVQWVEPPIPALSELNALARTALGVDTVASAPYGLDGTGVTVMVYDGGVARNSHVDFQGRLSIHDGSGLSNHATHVAGTIGGDGVANPTHRGIAPGVELRSFGFQSDGSGTFLYTNPGDIIADYTTAFVNLGAMISNNSIGTNTEPNGFPCSYQGDYSVTCATIDSIINQGINGVPIRIMWAGGNERQGSRCDVEGFGDHYSIAPPSGAKNHIAIGAINANNLSMTSFSSWGPMDDGRIKPDLVAPGCKTTGGIISTSSSSNTDYYSACGTSMASPAATGAAALILQDYMEQYPSMPLMSNQLLKTILVQTAAEIGNIGPDYSHGWGLIDTPEAVEFLRSGSFLEDEVINGGVALARVTVNPGETELRITLAWDDVPGTPNSGVALVNDLDLVVRDPSGVRRYPWNLDPLNPTAPALRNTVDRRNNVEQVFVEGPAAGEWTIEVVGHSVPSGPQKFALAASQPLEPVGLQIILVSAINEYVIAGVPQTFQVQINNVNDTVVPGSAQLLYRDDLADPFTVVALTNVAGDLWEGVIPGLNCDAIPQFYFRVEGQETGSRLLPFNGNTDPFEYTIGELEDVFLDDFTADLGWSVGEFDAGLTAVRGNWTRMTPEPTAAQPGAAVVGAECWVTDGRAGSSLGEWDVDDGRTTLASPAMDLDGKPNTTISYSRWFSNDTGASPNNDAFFVDISNDGGATWVNVETVGPSGPGTSGGWIQHSFLVSDFITPTSNVRVRFTAEDLDPGSLVEAAVDDFRVVSLSCVEPPPPTGCEGDINSDNTVNLTDFNILAVNFGSGPGALPADGDLNDDGFVNLADFNILAVNFGSDCTNP